MQITVISFFGLAVAFFITAICFFVIQLNKGKSVTQRLFLPTICTLLSVLTLRFAISFYDLEYEGLNWIERLLNSLVRTLQTFSLDEGYLNAITVGKDFFINEFGCSFLSDFYGLFAALTNICAPIMSGAILLGLLTSVFPRLRLWLKPYREKYVFSELNERSIYFAEDIISEEEVKRPLIVFTDAYIDKESEESSELLQRARKLGALCMKDDILHLCFSRTKKLRYILIDDNDIANIQTLTAITTENLDCKTKKIKYWNPKNDIRIYLFSQNTEVSSIVKRIYQRKEQLHLSNVAIKVVQEYTSIAYNLLDEKPLFLPLLAKREENKKELVLTIVGGGLIGTEVFLGAYWCGQMLDCNLKINVITEDAIKFKSKINFINPEILQSGIGDCETNRDLLRVFPNQNIYSDPYASFAFYSIDVETGDFAKVFNENSSLLASDYFVVALGSDELNMTIAVEINRKIQRERLKGSALIINNKPVIAYAVYDSKTKEVLNDPDTQKTGANLFAFAALRDIYSCKNIFMINIREKAFDISNAYSEKNMHKFLRDEYGWWSDIARALHVKYKMYSIGLIESEKDITEEIAQKENQYKGIAESNDEKQCRRLAWLEHRRWNAFMRTKGFIAPSDSQWNEFAFKIVKDHKHLDLKLHPCIVECSDSKTIPDDYNWDSVSYQENTHFDYLDIISIKAYQRKKEKLLEIKDKVEQEEELEKLDNDKSFKKWDFPEYDFSKK